jgi:hypothetical protein
MQRWRRSDSADAHTRQLKLVPEGPGESSPVRSAGVGVKIGATRPERDDR